MLDKATATNPDDRFQSADEMRDQLLGVLREVVAVDTGVAAAAHSNPSSLFGAPTGGGADLSWTDLPALRIDRSDPSATWLAGVSVADGAQRLQVLEQAPEQSVEVQLAKARAAIDAAMFPVADEVVERCPHGQPVGVARRSGCPAWPRWRRSDFESAATSFNTVLGQVPGELAPKLALALACEQTGASDLAEQLYAVCARD